MGVREVAQGAVKICTATYATRSEHLEFPYVLYIQYQCRSNGMKASLVNARKHGLDFRDAQELFEGRHITVPSPSGNGGTLSRDRQDSGTLRHRGPHHAWEHVPGHFDEEGAR